MKKWFESTGMINALLMVSLWYFITSPAFSENKKEVFYLEETMKPLFIAVNDTYCFIGEKFAIFQYAVKDFKFIKKIGGKGQGPGEFQFIFDIRTTQQYLIVSSLNRVYIYSADGEYIAEKRTGAWSTRFDRADGQFLGEKSLIKNNMEYNTIELLNEDLSKNKELYGFKKKLQGSGSINPLTNDPYFAFIGKKILVSTREDQILLFNNKGEKERELKLHLEKQPVSEEYKQQFFDSFKKKPRIKMIYDRIKSRIEMPDYFPAIKFILVDGSLIYLITNQEKDQKFLCLVLNVEGQELARTWIPLPPPNVSYHPIAFYKGTCFYLKEDLDKEEWMMIKEPILTMPDSK